MKVLLAEDDVNISAIAKMVLEKMGQHQVVVVHDGQAALDILKEQSFDVVLLDEMMPKMNGLKVSQEAKKILTEPPNIIFLSAKSQSEEIDQFKQEGLGFIAKPFDPTSLCQQIEEILKASKT